MSQRKTTILEIKSTVRVEVSEKLARELEENTYTDGPLEGFADSDPYLRFFLKNVFRNNGRRVTELWVGGDLRFATEDEDEVVAL
jgi:hypothetical protein